MARVSSSVHERQTADGAAYDDMIRAVEGAEVWIGIASALDPESEIVQYASKNEFGSPAERVPERSFMRSTADAQTRKFGRLAAQALKARNRVAFVRGLDLLGVTAVGDVQLTIARSVPPPNAASTIAAKGTSTTLIDSGRMRGSIKHETIPGDER